LTPRHGGFKKADGSGPTLGTYLRLICYYPSPMVQADINGRRRVQSRVEEGLLEVNRFVERRMYLVVAAGILLGWFLPGLDQATWLVPYLFAYMTLTTALNISGRDILGVARAPGAVLYIIGALHLVMPALAWLLGSAAFGSQSSTAIGMVLAALIPVGVMSVIWVSLAKGEVPLALSTVALDSLLSPLVLPATAWLFLGSRVDFEVRSLMIGLVWMIVVPTAAGILLHDLSSGRMGRRMAPFNGPLSKACALAIIAINISAIRGVLASNDISILPILAVLPVQVAAGFLIGLGSGRALRLPERHVRTMTFCVGLRNITAGLVIALRYFSPATAIPVVLVIVFQQPLAAFFQHWYLRRPLPELQNPATLESKATGRS
jgi:bile acid:Na+ symporter, BASS family